MSRAGTSWALDHPEPSPGEIVDFLRSRPALYGDSLSLGRGLCLCRHPRAGRRWWSDRKPKASLVLLDWATGSARPIRSRGLGAALMLAKRRDAHVVGVCYRCGDPATHVCREDEHFFGGDLGHEPRTLLVCDRHYDETMREISRERWSHTLAAALSVHPNPQRRPKPKPRTKEPT